MNYYLILALILFSYMTVWFGISLFKKRNDVADIAWGLGFVVLSWSGWLLSGNMTQRGFVVAVLVSIWGLRLALHIFLRNRKKTEDSRYAAWREQWGKWFVLRSYFQVYLLQGFLLFLIVLPVLFLQKNSMGSWQGWDMVAALVWVMGFLFESVGDSQLKAFVTDPKNKGKILQTGLWKYTRHPNYFGEVMIWWGIWICAVSSGSPWWTVIGPLTISFLILRVSGIPMLEKKMDLNPEFVLYKQRTNKFFPWFPKKTSTK